MGIVLVSATSTSSSSIVAVDAMLPLLGIPSAPTPATDGGSADPGGISSLPTALPEAIVNGVLGAVCLVGTNMGAFDEVSSSSGSGLRFQFAFAPDPEIVSAMLSLREYLGSGFRADKLSSF